MVILLFLLVFIVNFSFLSSEKFPLKLAFTTCFFLKSISPFKLNKLYSLSKKSFSIFISISESILRKFEFLSSNNKSFIRLFALKEDPFNTYLFLFG